MAKTENADKECPMEIGLNLLGGRWRLRIMWHLSGGPVRFNELKRRLTPITTKSLARELGKSIRPVMDALCAWGRLYGESRNGEKGGKEE